jgi:uncharacterized protein YdiU (UPF0061 family)
MHLTSNHPPHFDTPFDSGLTWNHRFATLGEAFYTPVTPTPLPAPYWVATSQRAANELGLPANWHTSDDWLHTLTGNRHFLGTSPLASVYSGHQFGVWAGQLGDGRALLLGETAAGLEMQLKGAGLTPYSRMGDGRAVLRSSIREFLCSEAMHGLGIPTTRALCVIGSDAPVRREEIETAAVVTRVAPSFIRFGHFEHFCHSEPGNTNYAELRKLADFVIDHFYPDCRTDTALGNAYAALLQRVGARTAALIAQWQAVGFCHGVMNTDNMSIIGLTLDYGPFQMMDGFNPGHVCNHSDHQGRYAFHKQPQVAYWNLYCLGHALLPLIDDPEHAKTALESYQTHYPQAFAQRMARKLGFSQDNADTQNLTQDVLTLLAQEGVDYTIFWRRLSHWAQRGALETDTTVLNLFIQPEPIQHWLQQFRQTLEQTPTWSAQTMLRTNPKFVLRNHLGEQAIERAKQKDFTLVNQLLKVLEHPFDEHPEFESFADFPPDWAANIAISCSS